MQHQGFLDFSEIAHCAFGLMVYTVLIPRLNGVRFDPSSPSHIYCVCMFRL
jgi:hypothetical protein